jgi:cytochrome P450
MTLAERLTALFSSDPEAMADPYAIFNELRETARLYEHGPVLLLSSYEDVRQMARENVRLSNNAGVTGTRAQQVRAALSGEHREAFDVVSAIESNFVSRSDGEKHARLRRIMARAFTPRRIEELRALVERYTAEILEPMNDGETVDIAPLAYGLPLMLVCDMLGVPPGDRETIRRWSIAIARNRHGVEVGPLMDAYAAHMEFRAYVHEMVERHRRSPGSAGDLVASMLDAEHDERMTEDELHATFVVLLFAGHETTTNLIGIGLKDLLSHPDQWRRLTADPRGRIENTIEELLRFVSPVQWLVRVAVEDVELGGGRIPAGHTVIGVLAAANRDPAAFRDPDVLDVGREEARQHLSLGFGPHFCIGSSLARLEGEVAIRTLAERFPAMELATDTFAWSGSANMRHVVSVPVRLGSGRPRG